MQALSPEAIVSLVGHGLTLLGIVVGVLTVTWQIGKQHANTLRLQEEHLKNELRVKLYERLADAVEDASVAISAAGSSVRRAMMAVESPNQSTGAVGRDASQALHEAKTNLGRSVSKLLAVMERYEIVFPGFRSVRLGISDGFKTYLEADWRFTTRVTRFLPLVASDPATQEAADRFFPQPVTDDDLAELRGLHDRLQGVCFDLAGYTMDVRIESQNVLLGRLFNRTLPPRQPEDPDVRVLAPESRAT